MNPDKLLKFCLEKGLLVDEEILGLFSEAESFESVKLILEKFSAQTKKRVITRNVLEDNKEKISNFFLGLPKETQKELEHLKIKLGLSIEISAERKIIREIPKKEVLGGKVRALSREPPPNKKIEVKDFVDYFRGRFSEMKTFLEKRPELKNLVSINKISGNIQGASIIGIVLDKRVTQNRNIILEVEDLTGKIRLLINKDKKEIYEKAEEISLDSVIGFKCSGNREILFVNDIIFPDIFLLERKRAPLEECAVFIGDLHYGSKKFMKNNFLKFIEYLNGNFSNVPESKKIKYLFIVGDVVTGVGNYPNQEEDLEIRDLEEQFVGFAELLKKIRKDIKIIISPGNHDGVRIMEPQPIFDEKFAWPLYELENVVLTENPSEVNIGSCDGFSGLNVLVYHGFSFPFYSNTISRLMLEKAMNSPEKIMKYLLKNRHLAPTHSSIQYFPSKKDSHLIRNPPDIFVSGHTHKSAVVYHNNILVISSSSWEEKTPYQEKFGNEPDHCKVPMFNLKTREVKILDFE